MEVVMVPDSSPEEQLTYLITQYEKDLLRICFVYLRDLPLAQDAVQETFIKAYKAMSAFRGESSVKTWLMRIAMNVCKDMRRNGWYRYVDHRVSLDQVSMSGLSMQPSIDQIALTTEIMELPRKLMEIVLLFYFEGMEANEISQTLGISTQAVYLRLKKARAKLKNALEGGVDDEA